MNLPCRARPLPLAWARPLPLASPPSRPWLLALTIFSGLVLFGQARGFAQEPRPVDPPPITAAYVPDQSVAAVVLHPRSFFSQRALRMLPLEVIRATGRNQVGIDPLQIEQVKAVVGEFGPLGPAVGALVTLAEPVGLGDWKPEFVDTDEPTEVDGKPFYPLVAGPPGIVMHRIDDRNVLIGELAFLNRMLAARHHESLLGSSLAATPPGDHVVAAVATEPVRPILQGMLAQVFQMAAPGMPRSVAALQEVPTLTEQLRLRATIGDRFAAEVRLTGIDARATERLEELLTTAMADVREAAIEQMDPTGLPEPELAAAMRAYAERVTGELVEVFTPVREDRYLTVSLEEQFPGAALFGITSGMLLPAVQAARFSARRMQSSNHLKQLALAMHNYHDTYNRLPGSVVVDRVSGEKRSWRIELLPFLEEQALYQQYRQDEPWDSEHNRKLLDKMPAVFRHPNSAAPADRTVYHVVHGEEIGVRTEEATRFRDFTDGLSNTIMFVEVEDEFAVPWTKPEDVELDPDDPWPPLGGHNQEGVQVAMFDGSVRIIPYWLEPEKLWALLTRGGGEVVDF